MGAVANTLITSLLIVQKRSRLASLVGPCPRTFPLTIGRTTLVCRGNRRRVLLATVPGWWLWFILGQRIFTRFWQHPREELGHSSV